MSKEIIKKYKGYAIRKWIHPKGGEMLIAIPLEAKCFVVFLNGGGREKIALKDIKLYIDGAKK